MMLQSLLWDDEVREADFDAVKKQPKVSDNEKKMAASLVENMSGDFDPASFTDDYQEQLRTLVAAKLEQGDSLDTAATFGEESEGQDSADVIDLVEALRRSVEANRAKRSGSGSSSDEKAPAKKTPAEKTAATKKTTAKKQTAKKATAKKTAAKKTADKKPAKKSA